MNYEQQALELIKENEALKAKLWSAQSILRNNLDWVRCGIGGNCSGYPKDHPDYLLQLNFLDKTPEQCLNSVKADAIGMASEKFRYEFEGARDTDSIEAFFDCIADKLRGNNA